MIESHHADNTTLIAVGGNYGTKLGEFWGYSHHTEEAQLRLLKEYADKLKAKELEVAEKRKKASAASKPKPKVVDEKPKFDPLKLTGKEFFEYMDSLGKS